MIQLILQITEVRPMNVSVLYDVVSDIVNQTSLEIRVRRVLRDCVLAMLVSRSCLLDDMAHALRPRGTYGSQYRRIQRFLANDRVVIDQLQQQWTQLVIDRICPTDVTLLVDETALSKHLRIMVLGMWTPDGCIPIAWRSYHPQTYPACRQVGVIVNLIDRVRPALPIPCPTMVLADRGIGTSPDLIQALDQRGIDILFRVQKTTRFRNAQGQEIPLTQLGIPGYAWQSVGDVFKKAGWLSLSACVAWDSDYDEPLCLVSTRPIDPQLYLNRFDQEVSFRDLKSDGFQWHRSHVWIPDHADRLMLILTIAYALVLAVGQALTSNSNKRHTRVSVFRRGLDAITFYFRPNIARLLPKPPLPPPKITSVVQ